MLAAAATGVQVGAAIVASRFAVGEIPPFTLALLRYLIGLACLLPFAVPAWRRWRRAHAAPSSIDLALMAVLGIVQFGVLIALLNWGLQHVAAARAALLFSLFPLFTLLLAAALGHERITPPVLAGVLLSLGGVAVALWPKLREAVPAAGWWGEAAVVGAAGLAALCSVLYRPYLRRYPSLPVSAYAMLAAVGLLAVMAAAEGGHARLGEVSVTAWSAVVFIGISSGAGYFAWLYALSREAATRVTVFQALGPVTAALLGWLLLAEPLGASLAGALALIAAGLALATGAWTAFRQRASVSSSR
ncbi:DMT family transporter [Ramlibacter sp.]|uniref:DMT family transporter n=1 Tax=Ramlibacter sp. TaxID=1917967 RepID=UPI0035B4C2DA